MRTRKINSGIYCTVLLNVPYDCGITDKEKCDFLRLHRIALWDVLEKGERKGSSDKDIREPVMNDLKNCLQNILYSEKLLLTPRGSKRVEIKK